MSLIIRLMIKTIAVCTKKYTELATQQADNVVFGGRLGQYRYYNMDQTIMSALRLIKTEFGD